MKILILSDIHANWPALQAVLRAEPNADRILCLGDLVSYGPQPVQSVNWAMQFGPPSIILQSNHDHAFGLGTDPRCSAAYQPLAAAMQSATSHLLTPEMKRFLGVLEPLQRFRCGDLDCVACHATPSDPLYSYLTERSAPARWESEVSCAGHPDILFVGHTHLPMRTQVKDTLVINPGSVGQPKDGDPRAAYAVWQDVALVFQRAAYDVEDTLRAFGPLALQEDIKQVLIEGLRTGRPVATKSPVGPNRYGDDPLQLRDTGTEDDGYALLNRATRLERDGRIQEALTAYEDISQRYAHTTAGQDAQRSSESLRTILKQL